MWCYRRGWNYINARARDTSSKHTRKDSTTLLYNKLHSIMPLTSDLTISTSKFDRSTIDQETLDFNAKLIKIWADGPRWYEVVQHFISSSLTLAPTIIPSHTLNMNIQSVTLLSCLILILIKTRSVQQNTANYAGKARHLCLNP